MRACLYPETAVAYSAATAAAKVDRFAGDDHQLAVVPNGWLKAWDSLVA